MSNHRLLCNCGSTKSQAVKFSMTQLRLLGFKLKEPKTYVRYIVQIYTHSVFICMYIIYIYVCNLYLTYAYIYIILYSPKRFPSFHMFSPNPLSKSAVTGPRNRPRRPSVSDFLGAEMLGTSEAKIETSCFESH